MPVEANAESDKENGSGQGIARLRRRQHDTSGRHPAVPTTTYGYLKSSRGVACRTEFENRTNVALRVLWLDFKGEKVEYNVMAPGCSYRGLRTFTTHPWVLEDPEGTVYAVYVGGSATVTVHGRDNFSVASGVQRADTAEFKDSVKSRVIELLKKNSESGFGATDANNADSAHACSDAVKSKISETKSKQLSVGRWLGWCMPQVSDDTEMEPEQKVNEETKNSGQGCSICCEKLEEGVWSLECGHMFHGQCLAGACEHHLECPVCRQKIAGETDLRRVFPN